MADPLHFDAAETGRPLLDLLGAHLRAHVGLLAVGTGAAIASPVAALLPIYLVETVIDAILLDEAPFALPLVPAAWLPADRAGQILWVAGAIVALAAIGAVTAWLGAWCWGRFAQQVQHDVRTETFAGLQELDLAFFEGNQTGQLVSVLNDDVNQLNRLLERSLAQAVEIGARFAGIVILLFLLHWQLALVLTGLIPILGLTARAFVRRLAPKHREVRQLVGALQARLHNALEGIATVKAYTRESVEADAVAGASGALFDRRWSVIKTRAKFYPAMSTVQWAGFAGLLALGGIWIVRGPPPGFSRPLHVGTFVSFLLFSQQFTTPLVQAAQLVDEWYDGRASAQRIATLRRHVGTATRPVLRAAQADIYGPIEVEDLCFTYPTRDAPAIRGASFTVEPGECVGIVGPTGSGKTTLAKLLLRFYEPDAGAIRFGGYPAATLPETAVRGAFGVVLQEPAVFTGTVRENIRYGRPDADPSEIRRAAERAQLDPFIESLPDGYDHRIGEGGSNLSGGQRQRLALARALLSDRPYLLLDEATSHVDLDTEAALRRAVWEADRTTVIIGHRLSVVRHADRIIVLEDGEIVERGTHEELLANEGAYADLWRLQVGAPTDPAVPV